MGKWRIYYSDGVTSASNIPNATDGGYTPDTVPGSGIQVIVQEDAYLGKAMLNGHSYYYFNNNADEWFGVNQSDVWLALEANDLARFNTQTAQYEWHKQDGSWLSVGQDMLTIFIYWRDQGRLKWGETIATDTFRSIYERALGDADMPDKNGYYSNEDKPDWLIFTPPE